MGAWGAFEVLFPAGRPLVYESTLNGKRFATQWTVAPKPAQERGLIVVESLLEIDPSALGQGGSPVRQRAKLLCGPGFEPVRYESESGDTRWALEFEREEVTVHPPKDEPEYRLPRGGAEYLFGMTVHQAIVAAMLHADKRLDGADLKVFLPDPLVTVPYRLSAATDIEGGRWFRSSHEEELLVDAAGVLRECRLPKKGLATAIAVPAPDLPAWAGEESLVRPKLAYNPPSDAHFRIMDVSIPGPVTPLGGALTIPDAQPPFPAVLFLSGSGAHDRHGIAGEIDIGTHEIMDHLAEHGFAGLRYDTRGAGTTKFGHDVLEFGLSELMEDARACFEFLRARPEVDLGRMFLIGHSQGGTLALGLVTRHHIEPRGIVLMACMGRPIGEVMADQLQSQGAALGLSPDQISAQQDELRKFLDMARSGEASGDGDLPDNLRGLVRGRKWIREHHENPATTLISRVKCPVLVCQGGKDFQVSLERDARPLVAAGRDAGTPVDLAEFPNLDHLFKPVEGESRMAQYYDAARHVAPEFLNTVTEWLSNRANR